MGLLVGDQREGLTFAARAGRRRHSDQRKHRFGRLPNAPIVLHSAAIGQDEVAALRCVHAAAATEPNDELRANRACDLKTLVHLARSGVFFDLRRKS